MDKYIGKLLGGRYEIIDVVGVGGMAVVYRARDVVLNRYVAVKILKDEYARDPEIRKRFSIESQAVAKLSHHNIVSVYDVGSENGTDYIVMELIEGITLKEYLQKKGHLTWQEAVFFAEQICRALVHAHSRGIIHQDIKPQNVIILRDGTAKLTDFGIASFATTQETRVVQEAIGSVHYISPEQAKGSKIDYRTDIYSLGVVMYEMLTGKLPFEGDTALQIVMQHLNTVPLVPSELVPGIPKGLDEIVMHAMCANISRRYASAEELYTDLERLKNNPDVRFGYSALVDDSGETQVIGRDVQQAARHAQTASAQSRNAGQAAAPRRTTTAVAPEPEGFFERLAERPGLAAGMAVAVVAVITLVVVGILIMTGRNTGDKVEVPSFVGMNIDDVLADTTYTGNFTLQEASERVESDRPVGEILEQDVAAKSQVVKGTVITLTVSAGGENVSDTYKVIDFTDRSLDYVTTMLDEHGIKYTTQEEYSDEVEAGLVIRTDPAAGAELEEGASITIYVSKGKETKTTTVPSLYGMTQDAARRALEAQGLKLGSVDSVASQATAGTVVWQSTDANAEVNEGTTINIQISSGPAQSTPEPDTPDDNNGSGGNYVSEEPPAPAQGSATVQVTLPGSTDMAHVVVSVDGVVQYDETLETSMGSISVPLTSTAGEHEVTVSVDGSSSTHTYTFS